MAGGTDGRRIRVYFDDGSRNTSRREGVLTSQDSTFLELDGRDLIPKARIIRAEYVVQRPGGVHEAPP